MNEGPFARPGDEGLGCSDGPGPSVQFVDAAAGQRLKRRATRVGDGDADLRGAGAFDESEEMEILPAIDPDWPVSPPSPPGGDPRPTGATMLAKAVSDYRSSRGGNTAMMFGVAFVFLVAANYLD